MDISPVRKGTDHIDLTMSNLDILTNRTSMVRLQTLRLERREAHRLKRSWLINGGMRLFVRTIQSSAGVLRHKQTASFNYSCLWM